MNKLLITITLLFSAHLLAGDNDVSMRKQMRAVAISGGSPRIDGVLDDDAWQQAAFVSDFLQKDPNEGAPPSNRTEIGVLYDGDALYIGARMFSNRDEIRAQVSRRDNNGNSDRIIVSLDTYCDRRTAYTFVVTAAGVRVDYYHSTDDEYNRDNSYNPVWDAAAHINPDGWTAEMRIPFSQLRFANSDEQIWGINVNRFIPSTNEDLYWVMIPKNETGWASKFGNLVGIKNIPATRRIELLPYETSSATFTSDTHPNDPFNDGSEFSSRIGADLKMGLGSNLTLDATINPDFGQVEADPAEVNLTAYETFFDEKRPFFIEGSQLFDNIGPTFFYSRRIGAPPHGFIEGDFREVPDNTTIISAAKLTGRLNSGLSIGVLTALTSRENGSGFFAASDSTPSRTDNPEVEPLGGYGVVRLQQEFGKSFSTVGLMFTGARRDVSDGSALAALLNRQAYSGNADWNLRFQDGKYVLQGFAGFSFIEGDPLAIVRVQRASARYFQRPDAGHVRLDSSRTSLAGYAGSLSFSKKSGRHWLWGVDFGGHSPNFELNDVGILSNADIISGSGYLTYRENTPGKFYRSYQIQTLLANDWNFDGNRTFTILDFNTNVTWKNFWRHDFHFHYKLPALSDDLTRGGPLMGTASDWHLATALASNFAAKIPWEGEVSYIHDGLDGWIFDASASVTFKPGARWELSMGPGYFRQLNKRQYFDELGGGRAETFERRYIFSTIERSELAAEIRLNYAFTPDLSLELYAEPFVSSGRWFDHGELLAPRSKDLRLYGSDGTSVLQNADGSFAVIDGANTFTLSNRDFNEHFFRSNAVLRWEWRRGSTLFLIWQQDRFSSEPHGRMVTPRRLFDSFSAAGDNFLAVKVTYWLPVN
jgi:hypothetical protein